jgi:hypothetical protein
MKEYVHLNKGNIASSMKLFSAYMKDRERFDMSKIIRKSHIRSLSNSLAPEARMAIIEDFRWEKRCLADGQLILPDCIAVGVSSKKRASFAHLGRNDDILEIHMPLTPVSYLIGVRKDLSGDVRDWNELSAKCSWDFFIASSRNAKMDELHHVIGEETESMVKSSLDRAISTII